ncbi:MAG: UDP-N-acetylmuramoyl-L-alanine--D-glutamate ligase [Nitrospirota bacterium]|nr:MAG: UDP-N-acetylmuramoyl-L-alanine--D-glutamate ligase [Nitrospirota bacterium]
MFNVYKEIADSYKGKRFHIIGIGRSGVGSARLLDILGADVNISDNRDADMLGQYLQDIPENVRTFTGMQDSSLVDNIDCLVLSPGVPRDIDIVKRALESSVDVIGEVELAFSVLKNLSVLCGFDLRWYGVTGTNGKSTTVTLLYEMLKAGGYNASLTGNIGYPLSEKAVELLIAAKNGLEIGRTDIVLELSSFQLELIRELKLNISSVLNITEDHLDRYEDMTRYADAKSRIFNGQGDLDMAVINADDEMSMEISENCKADKYFVSTRSKVKGIFAMGDVVSLKVNDNIENLCLASEIRTKGIHNLYNSMTAALIAYLAGVSQGIIASVLKEFPGLEHRLETVAIIDGVTVYNDSKGTNVGAVIKSLESFEGGIILIAGGRDKNGDFGSLVPYIKNRVKGLVLIGEAAEKIKKAVIDVIDPQMAGSLKDAVEIALSMAGRGDTVLFSPACASFDMFIDYEDRGRQFKQIVRDISGSMGQ